MESNRQLRSIMKRLLLILATVAAMFGQVTISNALKAVTTAGTRVTLTANDTLVKWATVQALSTNTGIVCFGGSTVTASTRSGTCLSAGLAAPISFMAGFPYNLANYYIDSTVNGEGVSITYAQ